MCGIVGFTGAGSDFDAEAVLLEMLAFIEHRGPDEMGFTIAGDTGLGAARLSIQDPGLGQQPFADELDRWHLVYNGEVYNYGDLRSRLESAGHIFETDCDTEVVLRAWMEWGPDCVQRLDGGFAFAMLDAREGRLWLVRDRWGKRPLFWARNGGGIVFASEMKCFLATPGFAFSMSAASCADIFQGWTPLPDSTPFDDVWQVEPGTILEVSTLESSAGTTEVTRYAEAPIGVPNDSAADLSLEDASAEVRDRLEESVTRRLRTDVPLCTYLSGGLDSAIVTLLARRHVGGALRTFSIAFDSEHHDESSYQDELSRHLDTEHHTLRVQASDIVDSLRAACWHAEVPVFRTAFVPMYLLSRAVRDAGIKVALTGEGADETFLGYNIFKETQIRSRWSELSADQRREAVSGLYPYLPHFQDSNVGSLIALFDRFQSESVPGLFSHEIRFHNSRFAGRLLKGPGGHGWEKLLGQNAATLAGLDAVGRAQWLEFQSLLPGYLLSTQGDRMSLAHSVENRCPFLANDLVAWAASLPRELKLHGANEKFLLKHAFAGELPARVVNRPKQPYRAPDAAAFLAHGDTFDELLHGSRLENVPFLDANFSRRFLEKLRATEPGGISPREDQAFLLLLSTVLTHETFVDRRFPRPRSIEHLVVRRRSLAPAQP